ncbi:MAG TPA: hypothetical protein VMB80_07445 [Candidatus Acidoferrum sp.]|nr:hypothetical protein [Candidatus Acidoferrum sp.]
MKTSVKILLTALAAFAAGGALVFYFIKAEPKSGAEAGAEGAAAGPVQLKRAANGETVVVLDAPTQQRLSLKSETLAALQWQPEVKGYGAVIDAATLAAAVADLESARTAAEASSREYERQKTLAAQGNASARALEAARATATHDQLAFESARAKFALDWGKSLADQTNPAGLVQQLSAGETTLVRVDLPAGQVLSAPPASARIVALTDESKSVDGELFSATAGVNPTTQNQSFFYLIRGRPLPSGAAVTGFLKVPGESVSGVVVPADAVLRYEGKGWAYLQTGTNDFTRTEIPLDRPVANGWFVSGGLTPSNRIVISGAQTVLSAELSGGNFNSGSRD